MRVWKSHLSHNRRKRKQNAARVPKTPARKRLEFFSPSEEERILRQQQQRKQTRLRVQALRRKRQHLLWNLM